MEICKNYFYNTPPHQLQSTQLTSVFLKKDPQFVILSSIWHEPGRPVPIDSILLYNAAHIEALEMEIPGIHFIFIIVAVKSENVGQRSTKLSSDKLLRALFRVLGAAWLSSR